MDERPDDAGRLALKRVRGQALAEQQAAIILAGMLAIAGVAGGFWWYQQGQLNLPRDLARQFDAARTMAQAGTLNVQITSSNNQTTVLFDSGSDPTGGRIVSTKVMQGTPTFYSASATWSGAITFLVYPDGSSKIYNTGACPSDLVLRISPTQNYAVSCDPFSVIGA